MGSHWGDRGRAKRQRRGTTSQNLVEMRLLVENRERMYRECRRFVLSLDHVSEYPHSGPVVENVGIEFRWKRETEDNLVWLGRKLLFKDDAIIVPCNMKSAVDNDKASRLLSKSLIPRCDLFHCGQSLLWGRLGQLRLRYFRFCRRRNGVIDRIGSR